MNDEKSGNRLSRRKFIRGAATVAPGLAAAGVANSWSQASVRIQRKWDKEADVIILGTGFAGLAAALTAKDAGTSVIVLEKMPQKYEGGNSRVSGNMWWTPTNLPEAIQYMEALSSGLTDKESLRALAEEMLRLNDWLASLGVIATKLGMFQPEHPELPGSACVRTWSNNGAGEGKLWIPIREQAQKRGIEILYETPAQDLVISPSTREIIGVKAMCGGKLISIKASKGVVLACGGFEFDFEMQKAVSSGMAYLWTRNSRQYGRRNPDGAKSRGGIVAHE